MHRDSCLSASFLLVLLLSSGTVGATDIYRWTDDEGVTHFSDTPPDEGEDVRSLQVNASNPPGYDPANDPYSIANQAKRINEKWSALAEEKEKRAAGRRESAPYIVNYAPQYHDGWRYSYRPGYYSPAQFRTIRRQAVALDALHLTAPRPHSINSGAHAARVENSSNFLRAVSRPVPHPAPRRN